MKKFVVAALAVAALGGSALALGAAAAPGDPPPPGDAREAGGFMLDAHLAGMKAGLKLNAEQAKTWPAFESAIRDAAKARSDRWTQARERMAQSERPSPIERMTIMADHIEKGAAELRKVIEASTPLYASLDDAQKRDFGPLMRELKPRKL